MHDMLTPKGLRDFLEINYSSSVRQMEEKGIPEHQFLTYLIQIYTQIHEFLLEGIKNNSEASAEKESEIILYRKSIEELTSKKSILERQNKLEKKLEDFNIGALDFSETNAKKKIVYLNQLGILDFLRQAQKPGNSVNALAEILSAITGEKTVTLQPYLNPIFNTNNNQSNNPLTNPIDIEVVNRHLEKKGFKIIDKQH